MIVSVLSEYPFVVKFIAITIVSCLWYYLMCGSLYIILHHIPRFLKYKINPKPVPLFSIINEIQDGTISLLPATLNITLSICLHEKGYNGLVDSFWDMTFLEHVKSIILMWLITEVFEWTFHWASHRFAFLYKYHKSHHAYANHTPFAVLSDHPIDMAVKSSPLLWIPFLFRIWDVTLVGWFATTNLLYGSYLHSNIEIPFFPSRHNQWFVSSWHHSKHHTSHRPVNFGFFTRFMDRIMGTALDT
jgi:Delta7-sterol 5-desaturase